MDRYDNLEKELVSVLDVVNSIISEKLNNYGIYCRVFSRIKTGPSIRRKLAMDRYQENPEKNLQDIIGIRVVLYYKDDIRVCKKIFENMLDPVYKPEMIDGKMVNHLWEEYESSDETFTATKINGVFWMPGFVKKIMEPFIEGLRIDPTFEIQLRTMFFEGWHEVEHDLRYKKLDIWDDFPKESRKLNSVLATLEMCDQYMVTVFDDIGHDFYKDGNYGQMIQYKYRLKTLNGELDEELEKYITQNLAKKIFKWSKEEFIEIVLQRKFNRLNANIIVYLVNESLRDTLDYVPEIAERFQALYQKEKNSNKVIVSSGISALKKEKAFDVTVDLDTDGKSVYEVFVKTLELIYEQWLKKKLSTLFPEEFDKEMHPFIKNEDGITAGFQYNLEILSAKLSLVHMGLDEPGKIWDVRMEIWQENGKLRFKCSNTILKPEKSGKTIMPYSRPSIFGKIAQTIGIVDRRKLQERIMVITEENYERFVNLLLDQERRLPVILISAENDAWLSKGSCYGRLVDYNANPRSSEQNNLIRKVSYACHVCRCEEKIASRIAELLGEESENYRNGIRVFFKHFSLTDKSNYQAFTEQMILEHPKDLYALNSKPPYCYMSVSGPDAMRHELIQMVCQENLG